MTELNALQSTSNVHFRQFGLHLCDKFTRIVYLAGEKETELVVGGKWKWAS
jgi:hypothetical protein